MEDRVYTLEELDKIAEQVAIDEINNRYVEMALEKIAGGLKDLGKLALANNDVDVDEKIASGEYDDESLEEIGKVAFEGIMNYYTDCEWAETDKEAHDLFHKSFREGCDEKLAELGVGDLLGTLDEDEKDASAAAAIAKLQSILPRLTGAARATVEKFINLLRTNPAQAMPMWAKVQAAVPGL